MSYSIPYIFATTDPPLQSQLQFTAKSVRVDNYTAQYLNVVGSPVAIPPYTYGAIINVRGSQIAQASYQGASGAAPVPAVPLPSGNYSVLTFYDYDIPPSAGINLMPTSVVISSGTVTVSGNINATIVGTPNVNISSQTSNLNVQFTAAQPVTINSGTVSITGTPNINIQSQSVNLNTQQPQTSLGNFLVNNNSNNATYNLPAGCHAVGIAVVPNAFGNGLTVLNVVGVQSGVTYISLTGSAATTYLNGYFVSPVLSVLDTQVKVSATTDIAQNQTIFSVAILDAEGVYIFNNSRQAAAVTLRDASQNQQGIGNNPLIVGTSLNATAVGQQGTWTKTVVAVPNSGTVQILASNANRRGLVIDANQGSGIIGIGIDTSNAIVFLPVNGYWEMPSPVTTSAIQMLTTAVAQGGNIIAYEIT